MGWIAALSGELNGSHRKPSEQITMEQQLRDLYQRLGQLLAIYNKTDSSTDWKLMFHLIFHEYNHNILPQLNGLGLSYDWVDPDCDYEDDVRAFMSGIKPLQDQVWMSLDALITQGSCAV